MIPPKVHRVSAIKNTKLFVAFVISLYSSSVAAFIPPSSAKGRLCTPNTRCTDYSRCVINRDIKPCAYSSGGAFYYGIVFGHGTYDVEKISDSDVIVTFSQNPRKRIDGKTFKKNGLYMIRLSDGTILGYPEKGGIKASPTPSPQVADSTKRSNTSYSLGPTFSGRALTKQGWTKPVTHQAVLKSMKSGKNLYGQGLVQMQLVSRQYALWVQVNCSTRDWKYLDHDVYLMGGVQEDFGRVDTDGLGKWACSKAGFRY